MGIGKGFVRRFSGRGFSEDDAILDDGKLEEAVEVLAPAEKPTTKRRIGPSLDRSHHGGWEKLSPELHVILNRLVRTRGSDKAARILHVAEATVHRALGPGVKAATRERLEARLRELASADREASGA